MPILSLDIHSFLCVATVPTPEQTYDALAPDLKKKVDAARAARLAGERMTTELEAQASQLRASLFSSLESTIPHADERPRLSKTGMVEFPTNYVIVSFCT